MPAKALEFNAAATKHVLTQSVPAAPAQQSQWFLHHFGNRRAYNVTYAYRLTGPLSVPSLMIALRALLLRHDALRTVFREIDGAVWQYTTEFDPSSVWLVDLTALPRAARGAQAGRLVEEAVGRGFDLARGPLFRAVLLVLGPTEHQLVLSWHHIVADGVSLTVLLHELALFYEAARDAGEPELEKPRSFAALCATPIDATSEETSAAGLDYFLGTLTGADAPLDLAGHVVPQSAGEAGHIRSRIPVEVADGVIALARGFDATLFMVLLAAWKALLFRRTGQPFIVVGTPVANRASPDVERVVGLFANVIPLATRVQPTWSFVRLLAAVRRRCLDGLAFQSVPFHRLVQAARPARASDRHPIFQTMVVLEDAAMSALSLDGILVEPIQCDAPEPKLDAILRVVAKRNELDATLEFDRARFSDADAEFLLRQFVALLRGAPADPEQAIDRLDLCDPAEDGERLYRRLGVVALDPGDSLVSRFEARVRDHPDAIAVVCGAQHLSYQALDHEAERVACRLRALGVTPESVVGLHADRSCALVIGMIGILKAGAAYLPIDPGYPEGHQNFIFEDARPVAIVNARDTPVMFDAGGIPVVGLDRRPAAASAAHRECPGPANLAYVIYTSGSTGQPKGALLTHGNVLRLFDATRASFRFGPQDVWCLFHSYAFDFSVWEIWGALLHGGRLEILDHATARAPDAFLSFLIERGVTVLNQTPSAFAQLDRVEEKTGTRARPSLVIFGGEALPHHMLRGWFLRHPAAQTTVVNMYGITETTVHVTYAPMSAQPVTSVGSWIGRPIQDLAIYLLDPRGGMVPEGVVGEIHVAGDGLSRGYLGEPALTAQRFLPDPFDTRPGSRMYRTGDLGRREADGSVTFLGRADDQIKFRGHRVEPAEIEAQLVQHPAVADAMVTLESEADYTRLVAYLVVKAAQPPPADIRQFAARNLPAHMVPALYWIVPALPYTPSGKLSRGRVPAGRTALQEAATWPSPPDSQIVALIATIWEEVLGVAPVTESDHFFDLGGHSLQVPVIAERLWRALGVQIPLSYLYDQPDLAGFARRVTQALGSAPSLETPIFEVGDCASYPLSREQAELVMLHALDGANGASQTLTSAHRLEGALDVRRLAYAIEILADRHAALRTGILVGAEAAVQAIAPKFAGVQFVDLTGLPAKHAQIEVLTLLEAAARRSLPLDGRPLFCARLLRVSRRHHVLILQFHHAIADGWSIQLILQQLTRIYGEPEELALAAPPLRYVDYAAWQRGWVAPPVSGIRPSLPISDGGAVHRRRSKPDLLRRLRTFARRENVTLFMTLLAAGAVASFGRTGPRVTIGMPLSCRHRPDLMGVIGPFATLHTVTVVSEAQRTFRDLLAEIRSGVISGVLFSQARANGTRDYPDAQVAREADLVMSMRSSLQETLSLPGVACSRLEPSSLHVAHSLVVVFSEEEEDALGVTVYSRDEAGVPTLTGLLDVLESLDSTANPLVIDIVPAPAERPADTPFWKTDAEFNFSTGPQAH